MAAPLDHPAPARPARRGTVCHLIASNFAGGPEKQILAASRLLVAEGWRVVIGSFRENRPAVEVIAAAQAAGLPTFLIETRSPFSPAAVTQLRRRLRDWGVEILVTHGYKPNLTGYLATRRTPVVPLPVVRGYTAEDRRVRLYEAIDRRLLRRFAHVLSVSQATRRTLIAGGIAAERIGVLYNAVDPDPAVTPVDVRRAFGWPPEARVLLAAGRLSPEKGHRHLIAAGARLAEQDLPWRLAIFGAGRQAEALRKQIARAGLDERVILAGFRRPILPWIAGADVVVNPSLSEGFPNVLLEALSVGRPVVATDVGGVAELITAGESGWLVPPADPAALARAIAVALGEPETAHRRAARGQRLVAERFSFAMQAREWERIFATLTRADANGGLPDAGAVSPSRGSVNEQAESVS